MKNTRKLLALLLSIAMLISLMPMSALEAFADNTVYTSQDGKWQYTLDGNKATVVGYLGTDTYLYFPGDIDGYTLYEIGQNAFRDNTTLTYINLSHTVRYIDASAFERCTNLQRVILPYNVKGIGQYAFYGCDSILSIKIPNKRVYLGDYCLGFIDAGGNPSVYGITMNIPAESTAYDYCDYNGIGYNIMPMGDYAECSDLTVGSGCSAHSGEDNLPNYYRFEPEEDCTCVFESDYTGNEFDPYGILYDENGYTLATDDNSGSGDNFRLKYTFYSGNVYYFCASLAGDDSVDYDYDFTLNRVSGAEGYPVLQLDTLTPVSITQGGQMVYFQYTPANSGTYYFESVGDSDTYGHLFTDAIADPPKGASSQITTNDDGGENSNFLVQRVLRAGETYIFGARFWSTSKTGDFQVKLYKGPAATSIDFEDGYSLNRLPGSTERLEIEYAPYGCSYEDLTFVSSDSSVVAITGSGDDYCDVSYVGSGTATITASNAGNTLYAEIEINVLSVTDITEDSVVPVTISNQGGRAYFRFVPSVSTTYFFESYGNYDTYGYVYDSNLSQLSSDDDGSGNGSNFKVSYNVTAGQTYYFCASFYSDSTTGSFSVKLYRAPAATGICFENGDEYTGYLYDYAELYVDFTPSGSISETCTFTSDDDSIAEVVYSDDTYCRVLLTGVGTATITAESENGLTATCDIISQAPTAITVGTPTTFNVNYGDAVCASFVPGESGYYRFVITDANNGDSFYKILYEEDSQLDSWYDAEYIYYDELTAGSTYLIKVPAYYYSGSFKLTVTKCVEATGVVFTTQAGYSGYPDTNCMLYAKLTPDNAIPEGITFSVDDSSIASISYQSSSSSLGSYYCELELLSVGTAVITATSDSGKTATYTVTVSPYPTLALDTPHTFNLNNEIAAASFTPSESGQYVFRCSDYSGGYYFYKSLRLGSSTVATTYGNEIVADLTAGNTYTFRTNNQTGNFKLTVSKLVAATGITFVTPAGAMGKQFTTASIEAKLVPDNSIDEVITFSSSDDTIAEVYNMYKDSESGNYVCVLRLYKAGTVTITASTVSGLSATYSYTVESVPTLTLDTPYGITSNDYSAENVVAFTPSQDGLYQITSTYPTFVEIYEGFNYFTDFYFDITVDLEAGKTYLIKIRSFTGSTNITVSKCVTATSLSFEEASYSGYEYQTVYISTQLSPANAVPEGVTFTSSNTSIATVNGYGSNGIYSYLDLKLLQPGTVTITATSSDTGLTATCTVTVQAMPSLTLDQKTEFTSSDSSDNHYYKFTPTVSGYYFFLTDEYSEIYINDAYGNYVDSTYGYSIYTYLDAGDTYVVNVTDFNGLNSLIVKRAVNATSMSLSDSSIQGYEYTWAHLSTSFAPDNAILESATFVSSDTSVVDIDAQYGDSCDLCLLAPGTATITATSDNGLTASCEITVLPLTTITLDTQYTLSSSNYNDNKYFKFTPSETGYYYFKTSKSCYIEVNDGFTGYDSGYNELYCQLQAGTSYVIMYNDFVGSNVVYVTKAVPATSFNILEDTVTAYAYDYAYLTGEFGPADCIHEDVTYTSSDPSTVEINYVYFEDGQSRCTLQLLKPGTAVITAVSDNGLTDTCTVTVKPLLVLTEDTLTQVQIVSNSTECYSFTPSQSGTYFFRISDYSNQNVAEMHLADGFMSLVDSGFQSFSYNLTAGKTYIFKTRYSSWYASTGGNGTFNIIATPAVPATSINLSRDSLEGYVGTDKNISVSFEPWNAVAEGFVYSSSDDSVATVDAYGTVRFVSAGTATITVTSTNGLTDTCTVTSKNLKVLTAGVSEMAVISAYGEYDYFTFTAPESGYYVFYSSADGEDTFAYAFDANMHQIGYDDDGGESNNFRIKREMTAGETYIFSAGLYDGETAVYPVVIEKKKVVTDIEILQMPNKTEYVKGFVQEGFNPEGLVLKFIWSDSTTTRYAYNPDNPYYDGLEVEVSPYVYNNGNSARIQATYDGVTAYGALTLIESPVASIELVYSDVLTFVENAGGYRDSCWNMAAQVTEYFYRYYIEPDDITIRINYKDGTSAVANVNDFVDGIRIDYSDDQYENHWTVGGYNSFTVSYIDQSVQVPVIIVPNGVDSIEVVTPTATTFIENCGGYTSSAWDPATGTNAPFYYYNIWSADLSDTVIRINYTDGTSTTAHYGDEVNGYPITFIDEQHIDHWELGDNTLTLSYLGATTTMTVTVVETPVRQIVVSSPPQKTYYFGDTAYGRSIVSGNVTYYQLNNFIISGLSFTVMNKNGTDVDYTDADIDENGRINGYPLNLIGCEYPNGQLGLTGPGLVKVKWSYMGVEFSYNVSVLANEVSGIQIIDQPDIASSNGNFIVEPYGLKVKINYTDSSTSTITFNQNNTVMHLDGMFGGGGVYYTVSVGGDDMVYYRTWTGSAWSYVVEFIGATAVLSGTPSDVDVTDVGIVHFESDCDGMVIDMCFEDGTSENLTLEVLREINEFVDGTAYIVRTSMGVMTVFIAPLRDGNNQIYCYWVETIIPLYYYLNTPIVAGDLDNDGDADLTDYEIIKAYLAGENVSSAKLADADINNDGAVDAFDLFELDKIINNNLTSKFTIAALDATTAKITAYNGSDTELKLPKYCGSYVITAIGNKAFYNNQSLVEVELNDSITVLDNYAFMNCKSMVSIKLNDGLQRLNSSAFAACTALESISLPNSIVAIGSNCFKGCTSLKSISIPRSITSLSANNIFTDCTSLKTVIIPETVTSINANAFTGCSSQLTIYGKTGSYAETYANAHGINFVAML